MATTRKRGGKDTRATRGTKRNPARGVVDLREKGRPGARNPFYATWYDAVNKRKGGSKAFPTLPEAVQWVETMERDNLAAYYRGEDVRARSRSFRDVALAWTGTLTMSYNTVNGYTHHAKQLIDYFGADTPVGGIAKHDVQAMLHHYLKVKGRAEGTIKVRINVLNQIMEYAIDRKFRPDNPCRGVKRPKDRARDAYIYSPAEVAAILRNLPEHMRAPVLLSYYGGLRIGEVLGLRRRSLDLEAGRVKIGRVRHSDRAEQDFTKGGKKAEWADLPEAVIPMLRRLIEKYPPMEDGTLFSHRSSHGELLFMSQETMRHHFRKACRAAGIENDQPRFHDLRHSCATNYARAEAPAYVIQALLRHARLDTSQRYIDRVSDEQRRNWANRVGGADANAPVWDPADASAA